MKVLLINPPRLDNVSIVREERCEITERYSILPPYSLLQIAGLLRREGHEPSLIDANGENLSYGELEERVKRSEFDIAIFRFTPTTFDHDLRTAGLLKKNFPGVKNAGICFTLGSLSEEVMKEAPDLDVYIRSDYEVVAPSLVNALATGQDMAEVAGITWRDGDNVVVNEDAVPVEDYNTMPIPAYDLLSSFDHYFINTPVGQPFTIMYTSKGCPFHCVYCTVAGTKLKSRTAESVLDEIRYLRDNYGIKTISFFDETFTIDKKRVEAICRGIIDEGISITWYCNTRAHLVDVDLLKLMYKAGCRGMSLGVESGSQMVLDRAKKGVKVADAMAAIKMAKKAGIKVYTSLMLGLPGETWETVKETIKFVRKARPTSAQFNVTVPYPGTELYENYRKEGKIKEMNWRELHQHDSIVGTDELSPEDLNKARQMAYRALYFNPLWIMGNVWHVLRHPEDFKMATRYVKKIFNNYFRHKMVHAH